MTWWATLRDWIRLLSIKRAVLPRANFIEDRLFSLDDGWRGLYADSPDGRWTVSWRDGHWTESSRGKRQFQPGAYLLYDRQTEQVSAEGNAPRPDNGAVANTGTFLLEEWSDPAVLAGRLLAFNRGGQLLLDAPFTANIGMSAISDEGRFALVQLANSGSEDSGRIVLFDLSSGARVYAVVPEAGWPDRYSIDDATGEVTAHLPELGGFVYAEDGRFRDADRLEQAKLQHGSAQEVSAVADAVLKGRTFRVERAEGALQALTRHLAQGALREPRERARALKRLGQLHESLGHVESAIRAYEQACDLNPNVGATRRLVALKKGRPGGPL